MMRIARVLTQSLAVVVLSIAADARAACTDAAAVVASRSAIDQACPCASAATRGAHVSCATQVVKGLIAGGDLPSSCRRDALKHAKLSVCGRPGAAVCCRISTTNGREKHRVVPNAAKCTSTPNVSACVSEFSSVPSGCDADGCIEPVCGNGVVEPGEECDSTEFLRCDQTTCQLIACPLPPTTCGNGVLDAGEACEPPGAGACNAGCQSAPCGAPLPGEIAVACAQPALTSLESLGAASDGEGYFIAWTAAAGRPRTDIVSRRFDADALPIDARVRVLSDDAVCTTQGHWAPSVGSDGQAYYASWVSGGSIPASSFIFFAVSGRRIDEDGTPRATDELAFGVPYGYCQLYVGGPTAVTGAGTDRFVAAWSSSWACVDEPLYPNPDAAILTFDGAGAPTRSTFHINVEASLYSRSMTGANLAALGDDALAVWRVIRLDSPTPPFVYQGAIAHKWTDGALNDAFLLSDVEGRGGRRPSVAAGDGQLLVAWNQILGPGTDRIVATRVDATGAVLDPGRIEVATTPGAVTAGPVVAFDGAVWLVTWIEANELRAVAVGADGTVVDSTPRVLATGVTTTEPAVASVGDGRVLVVYGRPDGAATAVRAVLVPGS